MKSWFLRFFEVLLNFLPFQLVFLHLRKNLFVLFFWVLLFAFVSHLGSRFGVPQLFLSPEYLGAVDNISFLILGIGFGGFLSAFNLYSYVLLGPMLPFLGTVKRPLIVFSLNNSLIPLLFFAFYLKNMVPFQMTQELKSNFAIFSSIVYFVVGAGLFILMAFLYFFNTNKNIFKLTGKSETEYDAEFNTNPVSTTLMKEDSWFYSFRKLNFQKHYYLSENFKIRRSREWKHYDKKLIEKVFFQNHINTSIFELFIVLSFILVGIFGDNEYLIIPAGASIFLIFSVVLMLLSALYSWFRSWTYLILVGLVLIFNALSKNSNNEQYVYPAFGLNYDDPKNQNRDEIMEAHVDRLRIQEEKENYLKILESWKKKQPKKKPPLVILNVSGGGSRSALWSFLVLRHIDSLTQGAFMPSVHMITGASGGMFGASYFRELYLKKLLGGPINLQNERYVQNISKEMLNGLSTAIATRDIFFKYSKFEYAGRQYFKDRSHAFELQWHRNTDFVTEKKLGEYEEPERRGLIPVMVFSPTLINDGRRLLISSVETGFYQEAYQQKNRNYDQAIEDLEYRVLMRDFDPMNTRFSSVLRMSATFPYILPMTKLPGNLDYHVMDAGIRDNIGTKTTLKFLNVFEDWIEENTSGVLIVRIRDVMKYAYSNNDRKIGMLDKLFLPLGNMLNNFLPLQDYEQDDQLALVTSTYRVPVKVISFDLKGKEENNIALSFRLTNYEKKRVRTTLKAQRNINAFEDLLKLYNP